MDQGALLKGSIFAVIAGVIIMVVGLSLAPTIPVSGGNLRGGRERG